MSIDKNTGLPELPEGQLWRVEDSRGATWGGYLGWTISIEKPRPEPYWGEWEHNPYPEERHGDRIEQRTLNLGRTWYGKRKVRHELRQRVTPRTPTVWRTAIDQEGDYPTAADIRAAAVKTLKSIAERDKANALIGTYPPNKLEADE